MMKRSFAIGLALAFIVAVPPAWPQSSAQTSTCYCQVGSIGDMVSTIYQTSNGGFAFSWSLENEGLDCHRAGRALPQGHCTFSIFTTLMIYNPKTKTWDAFEFTVDRQGNNGNSMWIQTYPVTCASMETITAGAYAYYFPFDPTTIVMRLTWTIYDGPIGDPNSLPINFWTRYLWPGPATILRTSP